jgi:hypothetical protein
MEYVLMLPIEILTQILDGPLFPPYFQHDGTGVAIGSYDDRCIFAVDIETTLEGNPEVRTKIYSGLLGARLDANCYATAPIKHRISHLQQAFQILSSWDTRGAAGAYDP